MRSTPDCKVNYGRPAAESLRADANAYTGPYAASLRLAADWIDRPDQAPARAYWTARRLNRCETVPESYGHRRAELIDTARATLRDRLAA